MPLLSLYARTILQWLLDSLCHLAQGGKPEQATTCPPSTMAILHQGLPAAGSSCPDTAMSPITGASCPPRPAAILEQGLPASGSSCPDAATSSTRGAAVSAAFQGLQQNPDLMESDGDESAATWEAMMDLLSEDTEAAAPAACPASPPQAASPRSCTGECAFYGLHP